MAIYSEWCRHEHGRCPLIIRVTESLGDCCDVLTVSMPFELGAIDRRIVALFEAALHVPLLLMRVSGLSLLPLLDAAVCGEV